MENKKNLFPIHDVLVSRKDKEKYLNQKSKVFWFTGLSGSGKSTIAEGVEKILFSNGYLIQMLDGDNTRTGISGDLGFSLVDRRENIRRIAEVTKLFVHCGIICLNSFVSPTIEIRNLARSIIGKDDFRMIYVSTSLEECERRDVKGLYQKARAGEIFGFTGIDSPYEPPVDADLIIHTEAMSVFESIKVVSDYICSQI